ncbi:MAG: rhodanese-like domain-containing protein [Desulfitobacterium sp.]|nr:rhodanese-like domain-containing protein [Desulfitobacterium sp.]
MKKLFSLTMCLLLALAMLVGCSSGKDRADADIDWQYKTVDEVKAMLDAQESVIVLDTRLEEKYNEGHIPGSIHKAVFPLDTPELENALKELVTELQGDDPIVVVCNSGQKVAKRAVSVLQDEGIAPERLFILEGGAGAWISSQEASAEGGSSDDECS